MKCPQCGEQCHRDSADGSSKGPWRCSECGWYEGYRVDALIDAEREQERGIKCAHTTCNNTVPPGWEGGYCVECCRAIEHAEDERQEQYAKEAYAEYEALPEEEKNRKPVDPYAEYGFDHPWELF